jgi:hypothetical protein
MSTRVLELPGTLATPYIGKHLLGLPTAFDIHILGKTHLIRGLTNLNDLSGNAHTWTKSGTIPDGDTSITMPVNTYFLPAWTLDQLAAAGTANEFTAMFIGKADSTDDVNWMNCSGVTGVNRATNLRTGTTFDTLGSGGDNISAISATIGGKSAWRDTDFALFGISMSAYNKFSFVIHNDAMVTSATAIPVTDQSGRAVGGPAPRLFQLVGGAPQVVAGLFFDHLLSDEEAFRAYKRMQDVVGSSGIII